MTASVHADNIGSSPNVTTTGPIVMYVGVEVPANTTFRAASGGATYTTSLQTVSARFPDSPGVYWVGPVTRTYDFDVAFDVAADLDEGELITVTTHLAMGSGPTNTFGCRIQSASSAPLVFRC